MRRYLIVALCLAFATSNSLARTTHWYIEHAPHSKQCRVTEKRPDGKHMIRVGMTYTEKHSAETALKKRPECK